MRSKLPHKLLFKILTRTPDMIPFFTKSLYRKHVGTNKDYKLGTGEAIKQPYQISLRITNACNHRCAVCGQYGEHGYMHDPEKKKDLMKTIPVERYIELVDSMDKDKPFYYVTGGEPFLYKDFMKLMNYIKSKGSPLSVVTNGVKLKENAESIVKNGWDMILVSFDGPEDVHDKCRGFEGAYQTTIDGLKELNMWKKKLGKKKPYVVTSTTLSTANIDYLKDTFEIGKEIEPDIMVAYLSWFTSTKIGEAQTKILKENLGVDAYTWKSYVQDFKIEDVERFQKSLNDIEKMKWPFEYMVIPDLKGDDFTRYYMEPEELFGFAKCVAPFIMVDIMPNGDVVTCRDFIDVKVGNIMEDKLMDIWNNDEFKAFRKLLLDNGGTLPQCSRCCGLMGF